jgi:hypothetical protein
MKHPKKILLLAFSVIICCSLFASVSNFQHSVVVQCEPPVCLYRDDCSVNFDSLRELYAQNKSFIEDYEKQCLIALSYYPELKGCTIKFKYAKIKTTMNCRPSAQGLVRGNREYQIRINNHPDFKGVLLQDAPFNAQIGVIGHEIAHVLDYEERNVAGVIKRGIDYLTPKTKREYERKIDLLTIQRGLGWQLYDWANFSMHQSTRATEKYKQFKQDTYMSSSEIEEVIAITDCYNYTIETK